MITCQFLRNAKLKEITSFSRPELVMTMHDDDEDDEDDMMMMMMRMMMRMMKMI